MLRRAIVAYGLLSVIIAVVLLLTVQAAIVPALYLGVNGLIVVGALLFERQRYRPAVDRAQGPWQLTGERFVDPSSGQMVEVRYNPQTGQRDYTSADDDNQWRRDEERSGRGKIWEGYVGMSTRSPESNSDVAALEARDVHKSLPLATGQLEILKGISFRIAKGEIAAIVGPSGSGKSTLLGIIAGLDNPTSGQVLIDGTDVTHLNEAQMAGIRNTKIGMVFQAYNLIPTLTAQENVEVPLYVGNHPGSPSARARELLTLVGLEHRFDHQPRQLSGGEQQRVAIARALATNPAIVIADEPTGNLDQQNGQVVLDLIRTLRDGTGTTFIIATHDPNVAGAADRSLTIVDGLLVADSAVTTTPAVPAGGGGR